MTESNITLICECGAHNVIPKAEYRRDEEHCDVCGNFLPHTSALVPEILIRLNTGQLVDLLAPQKTRFSKEAMATAGAKLCRFSGQTKRFYSVAEHSVLVSRLVERMGGDPWAALWHEAGEFLGMGDLVTPLKRMVPLYGEIEDGVLAAVAEQFGFKMPFESKLHVADRVLCEIEGRALVNGWASGAILSPAEHSLLQGIEPHCLEPELAEAVFLERMWALQP